MNTRINSLKPIALRPAAATTILLGGGLVAVLDITNAMTFWALYRHVSPVRILQSVACGLLGKEAFTGGVSAAVLGAGLHTLIALGVAAVFYAACRLWPALLRWAVPVGLIYGLIVFAVMNHVVIPLSRVPPPTHARALPWLLDDLIGHAVLIGLPVALVARWSARPDTAYPAK